MKPYNKEVADWVAGLRKRRNDLNILRKPTALRINRTGKIQPSL
jgi:hypothetical protein